MNGLNSTSRSARRWGHFWWGSPIFDRSWRRSPSAICTSSSPCTSKSTHSSCLSFETRRRLRRHVQRKLIRLNDQLSRRNGELLELREELQIQLKSTSRQLGSLERLKAGLVENASSVGPDRARDTQDPSLQQGSGADLRHARQRAGWTQHRRHPTPHRRCAAGRVHRADRLHGHVGLRKLKVKLSNGIERVIYLRGEAFERRDGALRATIFVLDDVPDREELIQGFLAICRPTWPATSTLAARAARSYERASTRRCSRSG